MSMRTVTWETVETVKHKDERWVCDWCNGPEHRWEDVREKWIMCVRYLKWPSEVATIEHHICPTCWEAKKP